VPVVNAKPKATKSHRFVEIVQAWQVEGAPVLNTWDGVFAPTRIAATFRNGTLIDVELYGRDSDGEEGSCTYSAHDDRIPEWVRPYLDPATNDIR
jgi:hypothetical protein